MTTVKYGLFQFTNTVGVREMTWVTTHLNSWGQYYIATSVHMEWPVFGKLAPCDGRLLLVHNKKHLSKFYL